MCASDKAKDISCICVGIMPRATIFSFQYYKHSHLVKLRNFQSNYAFRHMREKQVRCGLSFSPSLPARRGRDVGQNFFTSPHFLV